MFMRTSLRQPYKQFFGTIANHCRLEIIQALSDGPSNVSSLCLKTKQNQTTISHNLRRLEHCGFVFVKPNGRERVYTLNQKTIKPLFSLMQTHMENHCKKYLEGQQCHTH